MLGSPGTIPLKYVVGLGEASNTSLVEHLRDHFSSTGALHRSVDRRTRGDGRGCGRTLTTSACLSPLPFVARLGRENRTTRTGL